MADYIYENARGEWTACGDYDFARRELLEQHGFELVEVIGEPLVFNAQPEPTPSADQDDEQ